MAKPAVVPGRIILNIRNGYEMKYKFVIRALAFFCCTLLLGCDRQGTDNAPVVDAGPDQQALSVNPAADSAVGTITAELMHG